MRNTPDRMPTRNELNELLSKASLNQLNIFDDQNGIIIWLTKSLLKVVEDDADSLKEAQKDST